VNAKRLAKSRDKQLKCNKTDDPRAEHEAKYMVTKKENGDGADDKERGWEKLHHHCVVKGLKCLREFTDAPRERTGKLSGKKTIRVTHKIPKRSAIERGHNTGIKKDDGVHMCTTHRPFKGVQETDDDERSKKCRQNGVRRGADDELIEKLTQVPGRRKLRYLEKHGACDKQSEEPPVLGDFFGIRFEDGAGSAGALGRLIFHFSILPLF
jgi:hypothetical protein